MRQLPEQSSSAEASDPDVAVLIEFLKAIIRGETMPVFGTESFERYVGSLTQVIRNGRDEDLRQLGHATLRQFLELSQASVASAKFVVEQRRTFAGGGSLP
jgi:hypothetical protein